MGNFTKTTKKERNYIKGSAKSVQFANGGEVIHVDMLLEDLQRLPVNKSGYIKISISSLPKPDKFGNTHSIFENDFVPDGKFAAKAPVPQTTSTRRGGPTTNDTPF